MAPQPHPPTLSPPSSPKTAISPPHPPTTIHALPTELLLLIASHLTYPALPLLRFTHPFFYHALPATPPTPTELLAAELTPLATTLTLLGCTSCLRMLPARFFRASQRAPARGCSPDGRQCYRCECQCLQQWRLWHALPLLSVRPQEVQRVEPGGRSAGRVNCRLCWAPLAEGEALKRKRWGYCEGCARVGSGRTVGGMLEPVSVEEWGRRWGRGWKKGG